MKSTLGMLREERKGDKLSERERVTEKENKMHKNIHVHISHAHVPVTKRRKRIL